MRTLLNKSTVSWSKTNNNWIHAVLIASVSTGCNSEMYNSCYFSFCLFPLQGSHCWPLTLTSSFSAAHFHPVLIPVSILILHTSLSAWGLVVLQVSRFSRSLLPTVVVVTVTVNVGASVLCLSRQWSRKGNTRVEPRALHSTEIILCRVLKHS